MFLLLNSDHIDKGLTSAIYNFAELKTRYPDLKLLDKSQYTNQPLVSYNINHDANIECLHILRKIDYVIYQLYVIREIIYQNKLNKEITYQNVIELFDNKKDFPDYINPDTIKDPLLYFFSHQPYHYYKIHEFISNKVYLNSKDFNINNEELLNFIIGSGVHFTKQQIIHNLDKLDIGLPKNNFNTYIYCRKNKLSSSKTILAKKYFKDDNLVDFDEVMQINEKEFNLIIIDDVSATGTSILSLFDEYYYNNTKSNKINLYLYLAFMTNYSYNTLSNMKEKLKANIEVHIKYSAKYLSIDEMIEKYKFKHLDNSNTNVTLVYSSDLGLNVHSSSSYSQFVEYTSKIKVYQKLVVFDFDFTLTDQVNIRPYTKELVRHLRENNYKLCVWTHRYKEECDDFFYNTINRIFGEIDIYYREDCIDDKKDLNYLSGIYYIDDITIIDDRNDLINIGEKGKLIQVKQFTEDDHNDKEFLKLISLLV